MGQDQEQPEGITVTDHLDFLNPAPPVQAPPAPSAGATPTGAGVPGVAPITPPEQAPSTPGMDSPEFRKYQADQADFRAWQAAQARMEEEKRQHAERWKEGVHWVSDHLSAGRHDLPQVDVKPQPGGELAEPMRAS